MQKSYLKILICFLFLNIFYELAAEEYQPAEDEKKIKIIQNAVQSAFQNEKAVKTLNEVIQSLSKKISLDVLDENVPGYKEKLTKLQQKANQKFPASDYELEQRYTMEAQKLYPLHKVGDYVTVKYYLYGKVFTHRGTFNRPTATHIRIGSRKIAIKDLASAALFDKSRNEIAKRNYVKNSIAQYHYQKETYLNKLIDSESLLAMRHYMKYNDTWKTPKEIITLEYQGRIDHFKELARQRRIAEEKRLAAAAKAREEARRAEIADQALLSLSRKLQPGVQYELVPGKNPGEIQARPSGRQSSGGMMPCPSCGGSGGRSYTVNTAGIISQRKIYCSRCKGFGLVPR